METLHKNRNKRGYIFIDRRSNGKAEFSIEMDKGIVYNGKQMVLRDKAGTVRDAVLRFHFLQNLLMLQEPEIYGAEIRDPLLFHVHSIDHIDGSHGGFIVCDDHKL